MRPLGAHNIAPLVDAVAPIILARSAEYFPPGPVSKTRDDFGVAGGGARGAGHLTAGVDSRAERVSPPGGRSKAPEAAGCRPTKCLQAQIARNDTRVVQIQGVRTGPDRTQSEIHHSGSVGIDE